MHFPSICNLIAALLLPSVTCLASCSGEDDQASPPPSLWAGGLIIQQSTPLDLFVLSPEAEDALVLLKFPADGFQLGTVDQVDPATSYDPASLFLASVAPAGLSWHSVVKIEETAVVLTESIDFALTYDNGLTAKLRFVAENTKSPVGSGFKVSLIPDDASHVAYIRLRPRCFAGSKLLGLGEYTKKIDLRGQTRSSKTPAAAPGEPSPTATPQPFLTGLFWGISVASSAPGLFALETTEPDLVEVVYGTGAASAQGLVFHVFGAHQDSDVPKVYAQINGSSAQ